VGRDKFQSLQQRGGYSRRSLQCLLKFLLCFNRFNSAGGIPGSGKAHTRMSVALAFQSLQQRGGYSRKKSNAYEFDMGLQFQSLQQRGGYSRLMVLLGSLCGLLWFQSLQQRGGYSRNMIAELERAQKVFQSLQQRGGYSRTLSVTPAS